MQVIALPTEHTDVDNRYVITSKEILPRKSKMTYGAFFY